MKLCRSSVFMTICISLVSAALVARTSKGAQEGKQAPTESVVELQISANDEIAAEDVSGHHVHLTPVRSRAGAHARFEDPELSHDRQIIGQELREQGVAEGSALPTVPGVGAPGFYPADLSNPNHGKVLASVVSNNVYVNCAPTCWGTPATFLSKLNSSNFIHVTDEYVGSTANNRYPQGAATSINSALPTKLTVSNILQLVHTAAHAHGSGYGHVYHIFLRSGVDVCTSANVCYSPDNVSTFSFCAYHAGVDFTDIGHVLYTVEPYQNVRGCAVSQPSPNGALVDSTSSTLSHELIETVTDPDGDAWFARHSLIEYGAEIADICENPFGNNSAFSIDGKSYAIQPEYSNKFHACATTP